MAAIAFLLGKNENAAEPLVTALDEEEVRSTAVEPFEKEGSKRAIKPSLKVSRADKSQAHRKMPRGVLERIRKKRDSPLRT